MTTQFLIFMVPCSYKEVHPWIDPCDFITITLGPSQPSNFKPTYILYNYIAPPKKGVGIPEI